MTCLCLSQPVCVSTGPIASLLLLLPTPFPMTYAFSVSVFLCLLFKHPMRKSVIFNIECPNGQILTADHVTIHKLIWGYLLCSDVQLWAHQLCQDDGFSAYTAIHPLDYEAPAATFHYSRHLWVWQTLEHHILSRTVGSPSAQGRARVHCFKRTWFVNSSV